MIISSVSRKTRPTIFHITSSPYHFLGTKSTIASKYSNSTSFFQRQFSTSPTTRKWDESVDTVIVGGGCAGLAAAVALQKSGHTVKVLEREPVLGGRARTIKNDDVTNHPLHIGPHVVYSDYPNYFKLLKMLKTDHQIVWQREKNLFVTINGPNSNDKDNKFASWPVRLTKWLPEPLCWIKPVLSDPFVKFKDVLSVVPLSIFALQLKQGDWKTWDKLDRMSGSELFDKMKVTKAYQEHLLHFVCNAILNVPPKEVSAASFMSFYRRLITRPGVALGFVDGGLGSVLEPAEGFLNEKQKANSKNTAKACELNIDVAELIMSEKSENSENPKIEGVKLADGRLIQATQGVVMTTPARETAAYFQSTKAIASADNKMSRKSGPK